MNTVFDPLRRMEVALTPEEQVRQWFIGLLVSPEVGVPAGMMNSEVSFMLGQKKYRADILICDRKGGRLAVVECKRPEVEITEKVLDQALRYNMALDIRWIFLTNGNKTYVFKKMEGRFVPQDKMPKYDEMLSE